MPKKILTGKVVRASQEKTISVLVVSKHIHPRYKKIVRRSKKYLAHVEDSSMMPEVGNEVTIIESRPISKLKRFTLHLTERN